MINWKLKWFEIIKGKIKLIKIKSYETVIVIYQYIFGILLNGNEIEKNEKMDNPSFLAVLTGGKDAYTRRDGVKVIPIGCLR